MRRVKTDDGKVVTFYREEVKMKQLWDLIKSSVVVQGVVTVAFVGTTCYLYATGQPVPDTLLQLTGVATGFFFGAKIQQKIGG